MLWETIKSLAQGKLYNWHGSSPVHGASSLTLKAIGSAGRDLHLINPCWHFPTALVHRGWKQLPGGFAPSPSQARQAACASRDPPCSGYHPSSSAFILSSGNCPDPQNQTEAAQQGRANIPAPTSPGSPGSPQGRYFCLHDASWRAPTSPGAASVWSFCCVLVAAASPLKYLNNPPRDLTSPFLSSFFLFLKQLAWLMPSAIHQLIQAEAVN